MRMSGRRGILLIAASVFPTLFGACALLVDTTGLVAGPDDAGATATDGLLADDERVREDAPSGPDADGGPTPLPSCAGLPGAGISSCGPDAGESCCTSPLVPGGVFRRSYDRVVNLDGSNPASVSAFRLDRFEVTVARFRSFVAASSAGWKPKPGDGRHKHLTAGGLVQAGSMAIEPGWDPAWTNSLASTEADWSLALSCDPKQTWTDAPAGKEGYAINCATWYEAYAFCIWDGGFLPSEAEWGFAAAGGDEQRLFPWSTATNSTIDCTYANYADFEAGTSCSNQVVRAGFFDPKADGRWGQADLVGNVAEWTLDFFQDYVNPCADCVNLLPGQTVLAGGCLYPIPGSPYPSSRIHDTTARRSRGFGLRCARSP